MYLTNIKIQGFKSFARKTNLDFNGGITCIVGPNGCGKSNIVDAVRWVLGEQRSAILRSEKMENVIFSGSNAAKPLGMAEVSMSIHNNRNILPTEYNEVVITRRLYRSGESEYLLNKTLCRLKDIRDLFMDTGVGPDTYSVIELKMVETILSNKSDERLSLFEEAAGINKYKHRRNAAFRKMDATEVDLNRVADIISEVERNVNSLKRQVSRVKRYQTLNHEIEELDIRAASLDYQSILGKLNPMKADLQDKEKTYQQNRSILSKEEAMLERERASLLTMEDRVSKLQTEVTNVTESLYQKENELVAARERISANEDRIQRYSQEQEQAKKRVITLQQRIEEGEPQLGIMGEKVDALRMKHRLKKQELDEFEKLLARRRLEANEANSQLIELMNTINEREKERNSFDSQILHLQGRKEQLHEEITKLEKENEQNSIAGDELHDKEHTLENQYREAENRLEQLQNSFQNLQQNIEQSREKQISLNNQLTVYQQQQNFLSNLIEMNEGYPDGVQFILKQAKDDAGVLGLLADLISVPKKYRQAVEAILGEKAFFVVVRHEENALKLIQKLRQQKLGQVTFLVLDRFKQETERHPQSPPGMDGVLARISDVIQTKAELQPVLQALFGSYLLVRDIDMLQKLPPDRAWYAATLAGEVTTPAGILRSGRYETGEPISRVSRTDQVGEIQQHIRSLGKEIEQANNLVSQQRQQKEKLSEEIAHWTSQVKNIGEAYQQNRIQAAQRQTAMANLSNRLQSSKTEFDRIGTLLVELSEQLTRMKPELDGLIRKRRRYEDETQRVQEKLEQLEIQRNKLAEEVHGLNVDFIKATSEQNNFAADLKRMRRTKEELERTIVQRTEELEIAQQDNVTLKEKIVEYRQQVEKLKQEKTTIIEQQNGQKQEYQSLQEVVKQKENRLKKYRLDGESSADILQNLRLTISENEMRIDNLKSRIKEKYRVEITPIQPENQGELNDIKERLEKLHEKVQLFGPVNLMALDEYKNESERLEFLHRQRNDLVEARDTLLETIQVINKTAHDKFEAVFYQIRENFRRNYENFFEGGEGDLQIRFNPDDPLDANIIILARPRGKQLGALELLSAGEKALTAIALLFSIYQVKPSPFCILDEVDAPLDDVSVRRFIRVVREFSENVQFLIVTHNKLTMEAADYIYGVTMPEEGVSKIVSVELSKADELG